MDSKIVTQQFSSTPNCWSQKCQIQIIWEDFIKVNGDLTGKFLEQHNKLKIGWDLRSSLFFLALVILSCTVLVDLRVATGLGFCLPDDLSFTLLR
jgi:hypothetical protein